MKEDKQKMLGKNAQLALDNNSSKTAKGIPTWIIHIMEHSMIERVAGVSPVSIKRAPKRSICNADNAVFA